MQGFNGFNRLCRGYSSFLQALQGLFGLSVGFVDLHRFMQVHVGFMQALEICRPGRLGTLVKSNPIIHRI